MAAVLIVDDDADVLDTVTMIVERAGHLVLPTIGAKAALDLIDNRDIVIDLMITDVIMRDLDGFALARIALARRPDMAILFLSGSHDQALSADDPGKGFGKLLLKPISPGELRR